MRRHLAVIALLLPALATGNLAYAGKGGWFNPKQLVKKLRGAGETATNRKVAVHLANASSRSTLTSMSLGLDGAALGFGFGDGVIAAAATARSIKERGLKETLKDPVTETAGSIGFTGVGNALRVANMPILAEVSFGAAALLGGHGLKSAFEANIEENAPAGGYPKRSFGQKLLHVAKNPFVSSANLMRVLRDPRTGLAGSNAFMKLSLMAATAHQQELAAVLAGIGVTLGGIPIVAQVKGKNLKEVWKSIAALPKNPMNVSIAALMLTDTGLLFGALDQKEAASIALTGALASAGTSAVKAVRNHVRDKKAKVSDVTLQVEEN
jgi:hypothetical protein